MPAMTDAIQVGKKQAIAPWVANIQPDKTPFYSMLKQGERPAQGVFTWQAEQYDDHGFGGILDGTPVADADFKKQDRVLLTGAVQQFREAWKVTKRATLNDVAGVGRNEAGRQQVIAVLQLRRQMERAFLSSLTASPESGGNPYTTWGAFGYLDATLAVGGTYPIPAAVAPVSGTEYTGSAQSISESTLKTIFSNAYKQKKAELDWVGILGVTTRNYIDDLTSVLKSSSSTSQPRTIFRVEGNQHYLNKVVDIEFSQGKATLVTNPFILCDKNDGSLTAYSDLSGIFIDPAMWDIAVQDPISVTELPADGSGERGFVECFAGLRCRNPLGQGCIYTATA